MRDDQQPAIAAEIQRRAQTGCVAMNPCSESLPGNVRAWCWACLLRASTGAPAPAEGEPQEPHFSPEEIIEQRREFVAWLDRQSDVPEAVRRMLTPWLVNVPAAKE